MEIVVAQATRVATETPDMAVLALVSHRTRLRRRPEAPKYWPHRTADALATRLHVESIDLTPYLQSDNIRDAHFPMQTLPDSYTARVRTTQPDVAIQRGGLTVTCF